MMFSEPTNPTKRWPTRVIRIGEVEVGGNNPVRIQSMTTTNTRDIDATIEQIIKLADHGCEIVRVTVQGKKEAEACEHIKNGLVQKGYKIPLVADIHFYPPAAMLVAEFVDKIRINPGNYVDRRAVFKTIDYTDDSYAEEIEKINQGFSPLVLKCKERGIAMRIGTNHGSLSDRIMNRYGDTPAGMVESAIEFAKVCRQHDYHNFLFSMKASNPVVMMQAYRLLAAEMMKLGWNYPLHLGVTEAGEGEDGRVKSSVGIGSLLLDGLGDTIRVALTEDPWHEIDACKRLVNLSYRELQDLEQTISSIQTETYETKEGSAPFEEDSDISEILKREVNIKGTSLHQDGSVLTFVSKDEFLSDDLYSAIGSKVQLGRPKVVAGTTDIVVVKSLDDDMKEKVKCLQDAGIGTLVLKDIGNVVHIHQGDEADWESKISDSTSYILLELKGSKVHNGRRFFKWIKKKQLNIPVILVMSYDLSNEDITIHASTEFGSLLSDGMGDGIMLISDQSVEFRRNLSFSILQAARMRSSKTDFIACPGCGRTLFDIQSVTKRIQEKTSHLPGVKIAIMGCIVNGPGEMADADFGYVGSRTDKIDLYVNKTCVERNIDHVDAVDRLIDLIKEHGRWIEPELEEAIKS